MRWRGVGSGCRRKDFVIRTAYKFAGALIAQLYQKDDVHWINNSKQLQCWKCGAAADKFVI